MTPAMAKLLADRVRASVLGVDEKLCKEPETARLLLESTRPFGVPHGLLIGPYEPPKSPADCAPLDPLEGMPLELLLELADVNEAVSRQAAIAMATQRVAYPGLTLNKVFASAIHLRANPKRRVMARSANA